jgi:phosphonate transport system substrate-binding protein
VPTRQLELVREHTRIDNDANMSAEDKGKKLKDIETRLAELDKQLAANQ